MSTIKPIAVRKAGKASGSGSPATFTESEPLAASASAESFSGPYQLAQELIGTGTLDRASMLAKIREGLAFNAIEKLESALQANRKDLAAVLSIPVSTLTRRKHEGVLHVDESDRVVRFAHLFDQAVAMMNGDTMAARQWLNTPLDILDHETPLAHSVTELGARDVEDLIGRIRHGVFS